MSSIADMTIDTPIGNFTQFEVGLFQVSGLKYSVLDVGSFSKSGLILKSQLFIFVFYINGMQNIIA